MAKVVLNTIGSRYGSIDALNANFTAIEEAFENTFSRDGEGPNALEANLDAGSFRIINLPAPVGAADAVRKDYVDTVTQLLNGYVDEIAIVANNISDVVLLADNVDLINDVADDFAAVAPLLPEIEAVSNNLGSIEIVGLDLNGAWQQGVVYDFGAITDPAIGEVEDSDSSIILVAENIADVNTVADNIGAVQGALANATASAASAAAALASEEAAALSETNAAASEVAAELAETNAEAAQVAAEVAQGLAEDAQEAAEDAETAASGYATTAVEAKDDAIIAQLAAEAALASTLTAYDNFDDRYLGAKASDPATDNDGDPLVGGALYFQTGAGMKVWTGTTWEFAYVPGATYLAKANNLSDLTNTTTARSNLGLGSAAITSSTDYATAAQGALAATAFQTASAGALAYLSTVGTTQLTNNAVTVGKLAATLDYGSIA